MTDIESYRSWLVLNLLPDVGRTRFLSLIRHFGDADRVLDASESELACVDRMGPLTIQSVLNWRKLTDADAELSTIEKSGVSLVSWNDKNYPENLRTLSAPPPLLYYKGTLEPIDQAAVAIIGSRRMSRYGREAAEIFARDLAKAGVTVVSGLAIGVDSSAHNYALEAGGRTLAVLGNGLAHVYPSQHVKLAEKVVENGALISEMPISSVPDVGSFPQRNGIIAGLSLGVLVIEAARKSGTQITANYAAEENRTVYAVPGDITRVNSIGTNQLIKEGARLVTDAQDILSDLYPQLSQFLNAISPDANEPDDRPRPIPKEVTKTEAQILQALEMDTLTIDALSDSLSEFEIPTGDLLSSLLSMELKGYIRQEPGKRFRRLK